MKKTNKPEKIIDHALELLKTKGDHGLTMRQVAQRSEMSLSNAQHYFKNKDELLKAMADRYFGACIEDIRGQASISAEGNIDAELSEMLIGFLKHGLEVSEMCRIFREYWAIATRNAVVEQYLTDYYKSMVETLSSNLQAVAVSPAALDRAVSLIIPYVEGYSITARALPIDIEEANRMFVKLVVAILSGEEGN
ncbi:MAG: TetR/AcrR family transcriptional regulator [Candidatus Thiodiazotropha taylori]|nr:TetR/AcrR family transcriptional regulator [Candidatus Thiodiazotropha taylori]